MCGIAGVLSLREIDESILNQMILAIFSRGPDSKGSWVDKNSGVGLAHSRLAVIDLSEAGHQPMISNSGRYVISYNGEVYNHLGLRAELEGISNPIKWKGSSDTETLLYGFDIWGIAKTIKKTNGMFAFSVWDKKKNELTLGRDRLGEKPLYYGWQGDVFLFGSELKALKQHSAFKAEINRDAITLFLRHNYIPAPYSIYQDIFKLEAGCLLSLSIGSPVPKICSYWSACDVAKEGVKNQFFGTPNEAVDQLEYLVNNSIQQQMVADVPLGAFLSGGIDSSTVVALMQNQSARPIKTFTIGFHEEGYNEAVHAKSVAQHLGTEHTELYVTSKDAMDVIPKLSSIYCEPFSDSSQIPTILISELAKQHVTVSLSGDAGDELFCGYNRYQMTNNLWKKLSLLPVPLRVMIAKGLTSVAPHTWNSLSSFVPKLKSYNNIGDVLHKGASVLASRTVDELYLGLVSNHRAPSELVIGGQELPTLLTDHSPDLIGLDDVQRMMALDLVTYLPDDILVKVDRAAMAMSLETRVPFLDHRVVEFAWTLPMAINNHNGQSKWPLRQILYKYVPKNLIERPKMGFGVPIGSWLRGPLRDWAENLLDESRLIKEGYLYPSPIRKKWDEHLSGQRNWQDYLWNILMFQSWLEAQ